MTTTIERSITPVFETVGKRQKLIGFEAVYGDYTFAQLFDCYSDAENAIDAYAHDSAQPTTPAMSEADAAAVQRFGEWCEAVALYGAASTWAGNKVAHIFDLGYRIIRPGGEGAWKLARAGGDAWVFVAEAPILPTDGYSRAVGDMSNVALDCAITTLQLRVLEKTATVTDCQRLAVLEAEEARRMGDCGVSLITA